MKAGRQEERRGGEERKGCRQGGGEGREERRGRGWR